MRLVSPGPGFISLYEMDIDYNDVAHDLLVDAHRLGFIEWDLEEWVRVPGNDKATVADVADALKAAEAAVALEQGTGPETDSQLRRRIMQRLQTQPGTSQLVDHGVPYLDAASHEHLDRIADMHGISRRVE